MADGKEIVPMQLSLEQLNALKTTLEEELQEIQRQLETLTTARTRLATAKTTIQDLSTCTNGQKMLVPLNSSLYVPGEITEVNKVSVLCIKVICT